MYICIYSYHHHYYLPTQTHTLLHTLTHTHLQSGNDDGQSIEMSEFAPSTPVLPRFKNPPISSGRFSNIHKEELGRENRAVKVWSLIKKGIIMSGENKFDNNN